MPYHSGSRPLRATVTGRLRRRRACCPQPSQRPGRWRSRASSRRLLGDGWRGSRERAPSGRGPIRAGARAGVRLGRSANAGSCATTAARGRGCRGVAYSRGHATRARDRSPPSHRVLVGTIFAGGPTARSQAEVYPRYRARERTSLRLDDRRRLSLRPSSRRAVLRAADD